MRPSAAVTPGPLSPMTEATARTGAGGRACVADIVRRLAPDGARSESRQRAVVDLQGMRSGAERKHSWQLAEVCGEPMP